MAHTHGKATRLRLVERPAVAATESEALTPSPAPVRRGARAGSPLDALEDEALVMLARQGDVGACERLYRRHAPFALNLAVRIAGSAQDAEDAVHDAFLRAFEGLSALRNAAAFKSWLGSIVVHRVRSRLRRVKLMRLLGLGRNEPIDMDCIASPDASQQSRAELAQLYALLRTLPTGDRVAWTLRFVEGHDLNATAELCSCSLATVKRRIRRAQDYIDAHFVEVGSARGDGEIADWSDT